MPETPIITTMEVKLSIDPTSIENFNANSQEGTEWGDINFPFDANNLTQNVGTTGNWLQELSPGQTMTFQLNAPDPTQELEIEYIRLNPLGSIDYQTQSPREAWGLVIDLSQTQGAVGEFGSYYLSNPDSTAQNPTYSLVGSPDLQDISPNLSYTILFSFKGVTGRRHYCTIDPLIKTSSVHT